MVTHGTFKRRVRSRMAKTGESYTAARSQLIRKAVSGSPAATVTGPATESVDPAMLPTSDESMRKATGRGYAEWFAILDGRGARERSHTETAAWLVADQAVAGWWSQAITVGYERARGRALHQMAVGYRIGANRTIGVGADRLLAAIADEVTRARWLPDAAMTPRRRGAMPAALTLRFDWAEPASRLAFFIVPKGPDKATVSVEHDRLPDPAAGERLKAFWRDRLADLKKLLEQGDPE
jgi:hypothetical protein